MQQMRNMYPPLPLVTLDPSGTEQPILHRKQQQAAVSGTRLADLLMTESPLRVREVEANSCAVEASSHGPSRRSSTRPRTRLTLAQSLPPAQMAALSARYNMATTAPTGHVAILSCGSQ